MTGRQLRQLESRIWHFDKELERLQKIYDDETGRRFVPNPRPLPKPDGKAVLVCPGCSSKITFHYYSCGGGRLLT